MNAYATIDWMQRWANSPRIVVHGIKVPAYPSENDPIWETDGKGMHFARKGSFVFYFYTDGKPTEGYGGRRFAGTFTDGTTFEYKGAWSSRAGCVNSVILGMSGGFIVDVVCGSCSTAMDLGYVEQLLGHTLKMNGDDSEFTFEPTNHGLFKGEDGFVFPE